MNMSPFLAHFISGFIGPITLVSSLMKSCFSVSLSMLKDCGGLASDITIGALL